MARSMSDIMHPKGESFSEPNFSDAPEDWTQDSALTLAADEGLKLSDDHWTAIRALQEYFMKHEYASIHVRELHDALDEKFHVQGGLKYLYELFPGGPIAQGCKLAGLTPPAGATDKGFGSVV